MRSRSSRSARARSTKSTPRPVPSRTLPLQRAENLVAVAAGDTVRWVIGDTTSGTGADKRTHILVKPFTSGLATNLVVTTDRRSYHLQLTATSRTAMAALSWTYPADQLIALRRAADQAAAAAPVSEGLAVDSLHFNYAISGDAPAWRPLRAFDDGRQTLSSFPPASPSRCAATVRRRADRRGRAGQLSCPRPLLRHRPNLRRGRAEARHQEAAGCPDRARR